MAKAKKVEAQAEAAASDAGESSFTFFSFRGRQNIASPEWLFLHLSWMEGYVWKPPLLCLGTLSSKHLYVFGLNGAI